jgi:hypothetical protein
MFGDDARRFHMTSGELQVWSIVLGKENMAYNCPIATANSAEPDKHPTIPRYHHCQTYLCFCFSLVTSQQGCCVHVAF